MERRIELRRIIAVICAFTLVFSLLFAFGPSAHADFQLVKKAQKDTSAAETVSELVAQRKRSGEAVPSEAEVKTAIEKNDIYSLLFYFFGSNADYYRENGLKAGFKYFNADKYLKANPDVAAAVNNSREDALEHYLTYGALEGRACCTSFDPVIAITLIPEGALLTPDELFTAWKQSMGNESTSDYILSVLPMRGNALHYTAVKKTAIPGGSSSGSGSSSADTKPVKDKPNFTMMVYLCGTDLESKDGHQEATKALIKIIMGAYDEENVNVLVLAGGTDTWKNDYFNELLGGAGTASNPNKSAIFSVNKDNVKKVVDDLIAGFDDVNNVNDLYNKVKNVDGWNDYSVVANYFINANTLTLQGSAGQSKMGDTDTLVSLLNMAKSDEFKADQYGLSLWNHGGGSLEGVCFPDDKTGGLEISEIKAALDAAGFGSTASDKENKLGLLAFDACLMAGAETAAYLHDCYDVMYASEEVTYGDIDYYSVFNIANQRAGDNYLAYWLAIAVVEDRLTNYTGDLNLLATGALFENGKAEDSLVKLNGVAKILNTLAADDSNTENIYKAFKAARLKCEQIGSNTTANASKDYVDMKNFLLLLKAELDSKGIKGCDAAIDNAIKAADEATYANVFNYAGEKIFYNLQGSDDLWLNKDFWKDLKGAKLYNDAELCGANIYVPYYGAKNGNLDDNLNYFASNYAGKLSMSDYNAFIKNFGAYLKNDLNAKDKDGRLAKLTEALISGSENGEAVAGYAELLDMSLKDTAAGEVLSIMVKDYGTVSENASEYSSGDAFVDLCDTMDTMLVYITRRADVLSAVSVGGGNPTMEETRYSIDVVVGTKTVSYKNLNGLNSTVNIFTGQFDDVEMNIVSQKEYIDDGKRYIEGTDFEFVTPSNLEGYIEKDYIIKAFEDDNRAGDDDYLTVKGTAKVKDEEGEHYITVYHLFKSGDHDKFVYMGSAQYDNEVTGEGCISVVNAEDISVISFYHQRINRETGRLSYAEEYTWVDEKNNTHSIVSLVGEKEYAVNTGKDIVINGVGLNSIGSVADNRYYFAVSQDETTNGDDVFSGSDANREGYAASDNILDTVNNAMNTTAQSDDAGSEGGDVSRAAETADEPAAAEEAAPVAEAAPAEAAEPAAEAAPAEAAEPAAEAAPAGTAETASEAAPAASAPVSEPAQVLSPVPAEEALPAAA